MWLFESWSHCFSHIPGMCDVELCYCNIRIRTTLKWIWWSLKHAVCVLESSREPDGFCYSSIEKNPTSEKMVFSSPSLCSFCDWRNIASAEIFISILSWGEKNPLVLWHQNLNWILKYLFLSPFFVMMVYWKRKDEDGSWKSITQALQKYFLFNFSSIEFEFSSQSRFLDQTKTFSPMCSIWKWFA